MTENQRNALLIPALKRLEYLILKSNQYLYEDAEELDTYKYLEELLSIKNKLEYLNVVSK